MYFDGGLDVGKGRTYLARGGVDLTNWCGIEVQLIICKKIIG